MSEYDGRRYMHIFRLQWGTAGKMPRFMIDGRTYDTAEAVAADIEEAAQAISALHIPAELETRPIGPADHGPLLPSWREFRVGLRALELDPDRQEGHDPSAGSDG